MQRVAGNMPEDVLSMRRTDRPEEAHDAARLAECPGAPSPFGPTPRIACPIGGNIMSHRLFVKKISGAIGAHGAWKLKLKTAVALGQSSVTTENAKCDTCCEFGQWLHGSEVDAETKRGVPYAVVRRLHADFHNSASRVVALASTGRKSEAAAVLDGEFAERSDKLGRALAKWKNELMR